MKPLRRSAIFWCGLSVLCFLVWAWVDSLSYRSGLLYQRPIDSQRRELQLHRGLLVLSWHAGEYPKGYFNPPPANPFSVWRNREPVPPEWTADLYGWEEMAVLVTMGPIKQEDLVTLLNDPSNILPFRRYHVQVPIWALIAGFGVPWALLLGWRRRKRRVGG